MPTCHDAERSTRRPLTNVLMASRDPGRCQQDGANRTMGHDQKGKTIATDTCQIRRDRLDALRHALPEKSATRYTKRKLATGILTGSKRPGALEVVGTPPEIDRTVAPRPGAVWLVTRKKARGWQDSRRFFEHAPR